MSHVCYIDWRVHPFRADRWFEIWEPASQRALAFGAKSSTITRSKDDPLLFRQTSVWEDKGDFERYWFSEEIGAVRESAMNYYNKPVLPEWHGVVAEK